MLVFQAGSRDARKVFGGVGGGEHDLGEEQVVGMNPSSRILLRYKLKPV